MLVIEDEEPIREILSRVFARMGIKLVLARHGREGVELFIRHRAEISLVVSDFQMPGLDGLAVLREIRSIAPKLPVLIMSGRLDDAALEQLRESGASGFIDKPFGYEQIQAAVYGALA